jgi:predicted HD phosphohydrolase
MMRAGERVSFTRMSEGTEADYDLLEQAGKPYFAGVADRLLGVLESMREVFVGYQVSSLEHLLQTATRAERDGADEEMVVAALMHDIGDVFAPDNHSQFAASLLRPYVREEVHWIVRHHGIFQLYYSGAHQGQDPNLRERYRDSPHYDACAAFCERWDQTSFDPAYRSEELDHFAPMVRHVFARRLSHPL